MIPGPHRPVRTRVGPRDLKPLELKLHFLQWLSASKHLGVFSSHRETPPKNPWTKENRPKASNTPISWSHLTLLGSKRLFQAVEPSLAARPLLLLAGGGAGPPHGGSRCSAAAARPPCHRSPPSRSPGLPEKKRAALWQREMVCEEVMSCA